jgi:hypothetical protein
MKIVRKTPNNYKNNHCVRHHKGTLNTGKNCNLFSMNVPTFGGNNNNKRKIPDYCWINGSSVFSINEKYNQKLVRDPKMQSTTRVHNI